MPALIDPAAAVPVLLDYAGAEGVVDILRNLSGVATDGETLWTVSDEGRTVERLDRIGAGYALAAQVSLDDWFPALPAGHEADIEGIDIDGDALWLCGSHCRVRLKPEDDGALVPRKRARHSRQLFGALPLAGAGKARALPVKGRRSLRQALSRDAFLKDFVNLPSKENGLDIEGLAVFGDRFFLGLRGPVIDSHAMVLEIPRDRGGMPKPRELRRHFLWLGGLGVRDLAADGERLLVVAGPVTAAEAPLRLHAWLPVATPAPQVPATLGEWRPGSGIPEGICRLDRGGRRGMLVVYDAPSGDRIDGTCYRADWFALET